jgi:phosphohistidine phosphatase
LKSRLAHGRRVPLLLDLMRHGAAAPADDGDDSRRELTPEGARAVEKLAAELARERERPDRVFASPLVRAQQTARIVSRALGLSIPVEELIELEPDRDPAAVLQTLVALGIAAGHVLLVGHQPQFGRLVFELTGDKQIRVAPGTFVRVRLPEFPASHAGRIDFAREAGR